jgi:hypothetical protein
MKQLSTWPKRIVTAAEREEVRRFESYMKSQKLTIGPGWQAKALKMLERETKRAARNNLKLQFRVLKRTSKPEAG